MGWEEDLFALFDDLEQQASSLYATEREVELADRSRAEYQQVSLASRLMASVGTTATLGVLGVGAVTGVVERVAEGWLLLAAGEQDWILSLDAVTTAEDASIRSVPELAWSPLTRLDLASALRRLADVGEACVVHLRDGSRHDGVLRRIGRDFCELVEGEQRRTILVAFGAIAAVQSRG